MNTWTATPYFVSDIVEQSSKLEWDILLKFNFVRSPAFFSVNFRNMRYHLTVAANYRFFPSSLSALHFDIFLNVASAIKNSDGGN